MPESVSYACRHVCTGHKRAVSAVKFSPDGKWLASSSADMTVRLWSTTNWRCVHTMQGHSQGISDCAFSADSLYVASASDDRTAKLWEVLPPPSRCRSPTATPATAESPPPPARRRQPAAPKPAAAEPDAAEPAAATASRLSPCGLRRPSPLLTSPLPPGLRSAQVSSGKLLKTMRGHANFVFCLNFNPHGNLLATGSFDESLRLWDVKTVTR